MSADSDTPTGVRASDDDRERVAGVLRQAAAVGFLTLDEADERMAAAYAARYRSELTPLTADLPDSGRHVVGGFGGWPGRPGPADPAALQARAGLIRHAVVVAVVGAVLVTAWALSSAPHFFPAPFLVFGLLSIALHARWAGAVRGAGRRW
ncbi:MAG TPA: DUF1707 domain-containing protein [Mycobacteriales bacterium]|nr:DUF1707 domain-containing protein [Mycobacteriales bacterium]